MKTMKFLLVITCFLAGFTGFSQTQQNNALNFDGWNDYVAIAHNAALDFSRGFTVEAWAYTESRDGGFFTKKISNTNNGFFLNISSTGQFSFFMLSSNGAVVSLLRSSTTVPSNTWVHLAATYDNSTMKVYVNGVLRGSKSSSTIIENSNSPVELGRYYDGDDYFRFDGALDEVRIWDKVLTAKEILGQKDCKTPANTSGLVAYYDFNQGTANGGNNAITTLTDIGGNGLSGTLTNFAGTGNTSNFVGGAASPFSDVVCYRLPDDNFEQALIDLGIDTNGKNNNILNSDAIVVLSLDVSDKDIGNLSGIEAFTSLTNLDCSSNAFTELDNDLTELDVSANTALTVLNCSSNRLTELDVSANTALTYLECFSNNLTGLDVSANTALTYLGCSSNRLTELDVSANTALENLICSLNGLTGLDVSENMALTRLGCSFNDLTGLDVSANTALTRLDCVSNDLTELDVSENMALTYLNCASNDLTELDVSENPALENLFCTSNELTSLNVKNGSNNMLRNLGATTNPSLTCIQVDDASNAPPSAWTKNATASYSNDCSTLSNEDFEKNKFYFTISPNPTSGILNIAAPEKADYRLLNIKGQVIKKGVLATGESKIDVSSFAKGIYLLNIKTSKGSFTKKVVRD